MISPGQDTITLSAAFSAHIGTCGGQPCSVPILMDLSALDDAYDPAAAGAGAWLNETEQRRYQGFTLEKRRRQWLAGRICAKEAVRDYLQTHHPDHPLPARRELSIASSSTGRPFLIRNTGTPFPEGPDLSISHSGDLAMALAARTCCGVDIQQTTGTLIRVKDRFCTGPEERLLAATVHHETPDMRLALLWAAKEAVQKALSISGMPGFLDLVLAEIEILGCQELLCTFERRQAGLSAIIQAVTTCVPSYALAVCIP